MLVAVPRYEKITCYNSDINRAAFYGAIKIFKFLMLMEGVGELNGNKAIRAGSPEIVRLSMEKHLDVMNEECLRTAVSSNRSDLFDWILNINPTLEMKENRQSNG
jgi:hypothetical protein